MSYVHGYHARESERLHDQAGSLVELLHHDTIYPAGQPSARGRLRRRRTDRDARGQQPGRARSRRSTCPPTRWPRPRRRSMAVEFLQADIFDLPFAPASFDHVFVCFVLEHLAEPVAALRATAGDVEAGRDDHGDRGRSRLGVLPSRQRRGARGDPVPRDPAATRRAGTRRSAAGCSPGAGRRGLRGRRGLGADGLRRRQPPAAGRRVHAQDVHGDDRGRARAGDRRRADRRRRASTRGSATSTGRPRAAGRSVTRSSRASGSIQLELDRRAVAAERARRGPRRHAGVLVAVRDGPAGAVAAAQPHAHRRAVAAQVAPPGLALRRLLGRSRIQSPCSV